MSWIKCDSNVKAKCPFKIKCCGDKEGVYLEGSECDKFAQTVLAAPPTKADHVRAMSDEELAKWLSICGCPDAFSSVSGCEEGKCEECWMVYLKQPYKEDA